MSLTVKTPPSSGAKPPATKATTPKAGLRRELKVTDAAAFSIGLIGPVGAAALLGVGAAALLGRAAPLAFVFAIVGVCLVAYGFIKLSGYISNTGSVYATVGQSIGPRAGFVAGWALIAAYVTIAAGSTIEIGLFFNRFLSLIHLGHPQEWIWVAVVALAVIGVLSVREIKTITKVLLGIEIAGAVLVGILSFVILVRLAVGDAPAGQTLSTHIFAISGVSKIAGAAVFGFLAFAGFEGAIALGEESVNPRRDIPRALKVAVSVVAVFYLLVIVAQTLGYGISPSGVKAYQNSTSPYADLGTSYIGAAYAAVLNLMAAISLLTITIGTISGAARVAYAISRDAIPGSRLTRVNKSGTPVVTLVIMVASVLVIMVVQRLIGTDEKDATFYWLTIGTIALLVAYALVTVGALRFLFFSGPAKAPRWQMAIPILGIAFVVYTIYKNVVGVSGAYVYFPYFVLGWLIIGFLLVTAVPGVADRVGAQLTKDKAKAKSTTSEGAQT
jgi:amino acid transporter